MLFEYGSNIFRVGMFEFPCFIIILHNFIHFIFTEIVLKKSGKYSRF